VRGRARGIRGERPVLRGVEQERALELLGRRVHSIADDHRAVEPHDAGRVPRGGEQPGDVAVADDRLGILRERPEVDHVQDPRDAVSTARAEDRAYLRIVDGRLQVRGAPGVLSGEEPEALECVLRRGRAKAPLLQALESFLEAFLVADRPRGGEHGDAIVRAQGDGQDGHGRRL
jgi:hypothetical protein